MKNTGFSFFIIQTARPIAAMVVLFAICKPIAAGVDITGAESLALNCEDKIRALCNHTQHGQLQKINVALRQCTATCTYRPASKPYTEEVGGVLVWKYQYEGVTLPQGMPCALNAECDKDGKCICDFCTKNININNPKMNLRNAKVPLP
uniref:Putative 1 n=2 Tax=Ixodes ricinus TaxID=34613 RepID=V5I3G5_IXORI